MADEVLSAVVTAKDLEKFNQDMLTLVGTVDSFDASTKRATSTLSQMEQEAVKTSEAVAQIRPETFDHLVTVLQDLTSNMEKQSGVMSDLESTLEDVAEKFDEVGDESEKAGGKGKRGAQETQSAWDKVAPSIKRVGEAFLGFSLAQLGVRAVEKLRDEVVSSVQAFQRQEDAVVGVGIALRSMGEFNRDAVRDLELWARGLQKTTGYSDDAVLSTARLIAQLGRLKGDELKRVTEAAIDTAAVLGRTLPNTALNFARFAVGFTESATDMGIIVDKTLPKMDQFAEIMKKVNAQFSGTAQIQMKTMSGQIKELANNWDDVKKRLGVFLATFSPQLEKLSGLLDAWALRMNPNYLGILDVDEKVRVLTQSLDALTAAQKRTDFVIRPGPGFDVEEAAAISRAFLKAKKDSEVAFERLVGTVELNIPGADVDELKRTIRDLQDVELFLDLRPEQRERLRKLIAQLEARIPVKIELDKQDATAAIRQLTKDLTPVDIRTTIIDRPVLERLRELESLRPEIRATVDLGPDQLGDISDLRERVKLGPELEEAEFIALGQRLRDAFVRAFDAGRAGDALQAEIADALAPILAEFERQRELRIVVTTDFVGPVFVEPDIGPINRIQKEFGLLRDSIEELGKLGGAAPADLLKLDALNVSAENLETLRSRISSSISAIKQSVETEIAEIRLDAVERLKEAGDDQAERARIIAEATNEQTQALGPLREAYRLLLELEQTYIELLGEVPAVSAAAIDQSKRDLLEYAESWRQSNAAAAAGFGRVVGSATEGFNAIQIVARATENGIVAAFQDGANKTVAIFEAMVDEILEQLARVTIQSFFADVGKTVAIAATVGKVELPDAPVEIPVSGIVQDPSGGVVVFEGQVLPPEVPKMDPVPIILEPVLPEGVLEIPGRLSIAQAEPGALQGSSLAAFTEEIRAEARSRETSRRVEVRVVQEPQPERALNVTLSGVNDGLSVRRQLTSGALRREILRESSRGRL